VVVDLPPPFMVSLIIRSTELGDAGILRNFVPVAFIPPAASMLFHR
jgi:hypothetical protein